MTKNQHCHNTKANTFCALDVQHNSATFYSFLEMRNKYTNGFSLTSLSILFQLIRDGPISRWEWGVGMEENPEKNHLAHPQAYTNL